jgi:hypothetical protein
LERLTIAARSRARRKAYRALNGDLTFEQRQHLDRLLELRGESRQTWLGWLRQAIGAANPNNILACIERLTFILQLHIPIDWARRIHQNRLVQIAREGAGTDAAHLRSFSPERRYATLVATVLDTTTILIDETLEMHERRRLSLAMRRKPPKSQAASTSEPTASNRLFPLAYNFLQMEE